MKYKIVNNSGSPIKYEKEIKSLSDFAKDRIGFKNNPTFVLQNDEENASKLLGKTAYYDPSTMEVNVFVTGRHPKDILRSIAHELVHHMQNEKGELQNSGYMGQGYAQKNQHLRDMERQAYEVGNLCFRDWEDSLKEKEPTIYNERRINSMSLKEWKNKELGQNLTDKWGFKMDLSKLNEGAKPDFLDLDGDGDKEEPMKDAAKSRKMTPAQKKKSDANRPMGALKKTLKDAGMSDEEIEKMSDDEIDDEAARIRQDKKVVALGETSTMSGGDVAGHVHRSKK